MTTPPDIPGLIEPRRREEWEGGEPDHTFTPMYMEIIKERSEFDHPNHTHFQEYGLEQGNSSLADSLLIEILKDRTDNSPINLFTDLFLPPYAKSEVVKKYTLDRTTDPNANWVQQFNGLTDEEIDAVAARLNLETE